MEQRSLFYADRIFYCYSDGSVEYVDSNGKLVHKIGTMTTCGYRVIQVRSNGKDMTLRIHRLIALAFHNKPAEFDIVDHINRNRSDNRPENLRWTDSKGNATNTESVDESLRKFGVRSCENRKEYNRRYKLFQKNFNKGNN